MLIQPNIPLGAVIAGVGWERIADNFVNKNNVPPSAVPISIIVFGRILAIIEQNFLISDFFCIERSITYEVRLKNEK